MVKHQLHAQGNGQLGSLSVSQAVESARNLTLSRPLPIKTLQIDNHKRKNGMASGAHTTNNGDLVIVGRCSISDLLVASQPRLPITIFGAL